MFEAMAEGLGHIGLATIGWLVVAVLFAQVVAIVPGLGGIFTLVILLPFAFELPPSQAIAILVGAVVVSGTGNSVTAIMFGVPGSPTGIATLFDGFPMGKNGEAARAIGAGMAASALGGIFGALVLTLAIPIIRPLVLMVSSAEMFVLIAIALVLIAYIGKEAMLKSLIAGCVGVLLSFVGAEVSTGSPRYVFDQIYLWDGIAMLPFMIGLFGLAEMLDMGRNPQRTIVSDDAVPSRGQAVGGSSGTWRGVKDAFKYYPATLQSSAIGTVAGAIPGLGGTTAALLSYGYVSKVSKNSDQFGKGAVEGVIAADASQNSKDGGALLTTLALGIPGSASMAVLLAALITLGFNPGPSMLTSDLDLIWMIVIVLILGNLIATGFVISVSRHLARLTFIPGSFLVPTILVVCILGAFVTNRHVGDIFVVAVAGVLGYFMKVYGYSRAIMIIGFVLGVLAERTFLLSMRLYGWGFLTRPMVLVLLSVCLLGFLVSATKSIRQRRSTGNAESGVGTRE